MAHAFEHSRRGRRSLRRNDYLHPDGNYSDDQRAKHRGVVLGNQDRDGMTPIKGCLDPQARATWDAVLARWAAPGMCNPDDPTPCVKGTPSQAAIDTDGPDGDDVP